MNHTQAIKELRSSLERVKRDLDELKNDSKRAKKPRKPRQPSSFNIFMRDEVPRLKKANPKLTHQEAFSQAAQNWNKKKKEQGKK